MYSEWDRWETWTITLTWLVLTFVIIDNTKTVISSKKQFSSETKDNKKLQDTNRMTTTQQNHKKIDEGVTISARSVRFYGILVTWCVVISFEIPPPQEVDDDNKDIWYKRMHATIHKAKDDGNYELISSSCVLLTCSHTTSHTSSKAITSPHSTLIPPATQAPPVQHTIATTMNMNEAWIHNLQKWYPINPTKNPFSLFRFMFFFFLFRQLCDC